MSQTSRETFKNPTEDYPLLGTVGYFFHWRLHFLEASFILQSNASPAASAGPFAEEGIPRLVRCCATKLPSLQQRLDHLAISTLCTFGDED